ncbi:DUF6597 domain-containing transcriptional factor [Saccharospirillum salsuginis]|uniref:DUF6597 domain-containing protein n=1 Tax=Saccharospirillum salsuginis TaxID=418750 RepID=A0A918KNF7_9GAMM|nr:DUF6597 domain-containing transcriptional factor [Saccharospirillum salsuginis]GGX68989.1 hypothetical protein GCM10007392_40830 [Saccharospirillum salsuginis]
MDPANHLPHQLIDPTPDLRPFVHHLLHTHNPSPEPYSLHVPPSGSIYLSYNYGGHQVMEFDDRPLYPLPRLFVGGQLQRQMPWTEIPGQSGLAGVEFTATGYWKLV